MSVLKSRSARRRGAVVPLMALMLVFILGVVAFAVDIGYMVVVRQELQNAADSSALAGASQLADLGYQVDMAAAEPYSLPDLLALAERGALVAHAAPVDAGSVLPVIPQVLPGDALR